MEEEINAKQLSTLRLDVWAYRTLVAGVKLGIFDVTKKAVTAEDIAKSLGADTDSVGRLLNAFTAMGLLDKKDGKYVNMPVADKFLVKGLTTYYGDFILMAEDLDVYWRRLDEAVMTGKALVPDLNARLSKPSFTKAMHNNAQAPARKLSELVDFTQKRHLLDIGAGGGTFSIVLTNKYKNLIATAIDQPGTCETMREYVKNEGELDRIKIIGGDFFKLDFPPNDVALLGQILHQYGESENKELLKKVHSSLEDNGEVIITEFVLDEDRAGPLHPALFALTMLIESGKGNAYTFSQIESWLKEAGFVDIKRVHLVGPHTAIIGQK